MWQELYAQVFACVGADKGYGGEEKARTPENMQLLLTR